MTRPRLDAAFVAEATGGRLHGAEPGTVAAGVATDTRTDVGGRCFVALRGPRHDAHDHLAAAAAGGAALAIVDRPDAVPPGLPAVVVDDARHALGRLAAAWRRALGIEVVGITGSVGKTTSKALLHAILARRGPTAAAPSSWNNDVGLPLTLLAAGPGDRTVVAEIGTGGPGEIRALSEIARPDLSLITAVGRAHLGAFGSVAAIATEKASIAAPMDPAAPVVASVDAPHLADRLAGRSRVVWYGRGAAGEDRPLAVRLLDSGEDADGWWCTVDRGRGRETFRLRLPGEHNAHNAAGAIAVAGVLGVDDAALHEGLAAAEPPAMRLVRREVGGLTVLDDSWNASPESMVAALRTFDRATRDAAASGGRRVLVLGDMLELGPDAPRLHREVGDLVAELDLAAPVDVLVLVGRHAPLIGAGRHLAARALCVPRLDASAREAVLDRLRPGDHVLLKGSRGVGLERVLRWLEAAAESAGAPPARAAAATGHAGGGAGGAPGPGTRTAGG